MFKNSEQGYGLISIVLHWLAALVVVFMLALGLYMVELSYYDAWYKDSLDLHKSLGMCLLLVYGLRLVWRLLTSQPKALAVAKWQMYAAKVSHFFLYLVAFSLFVSGYLISTADGRPISVFSMFDVPALPVAVDQQEDIAGQIHQLLAYSLIALVLLHILAALKHHWLNKDTTLKRMLRPQSLAKKENED